MRIAFAALLLLAAGAAFDGARADPYRWCAHYSGNGGNGSNCYFMSLSSAAGRCRASAARAGSTRSTQDQIARCRCSAAALAFSRA